MRVIYGAGGHGRVVRDALEVGGQEVHGFLDDGVDGTVDGLPVLGGRAWLEGSEGPEVWLGIGSNRIRRVVGEAIQASGRRLGRVIHPRAVVSPRAELADGVVVFAGAVVNCGARVGVGAIVNTGAVIEHDCVLGDWSHVSPNATLGGQARVGQGAWVGLGAVVLPMIAVGDRAVLGGGAVAVRDVPDGAVWAGVPARSLR